MAAILEEHKDTLMRLYVDENKTLSDVMHYMRDKHNVNVGKATYARYLKTSGIRKREKGEVWASIDHKMTKRAQSGRKSEVRLNGKTIPANKVQKEIARHVSTYQQWTRFADTAPSPKTPAGYEIATPTFSLGASSPEGHTDASDISSMSPGSLEHHAQANTQHENEVVDITALLDEKESLFETLRDCTKFNPVHCAPGACACSGCLGHRFVRYVSNVVTASRGGVVMKADLWPSNDSFDMLLSTYKQDVNGLQEKLANINKRNYAKVLRALLYLAAGNGAIGVSGVLLGAIGNVNWKDAKGRTCLHVASLRNQPDMVGFLIEVGADVNAVSKDGDTPWTVIGDKDSHEEVSQRLIQAGAKVNHKRRKTGMTRLCEEAALGNINSVRVLLRRGADPYYRAYLGLTPRFYAGNLAVIRLLAEAHAQRIAALRASGTHVDTQPWGQKNKHTASYKAIGSDEIQKMIREISLRENLTEPLDELAGPLEELAEPLEELAELPELLVGPHEAQKRVPIKTVTRPSTSRDPVMGSPRKSFTLTPASSGSPMQFEYHSISAASETRLFRSLFMGHSASSNSSSWARNRMVVDERFEVPKPSVINKGHLSQTPDMQEMVM